MKRSVIKNPVLFIHGFGGGEREYQPIISFLKSRRSFPCYEFSYTKNIGQVSLREITEELHEFVRKYVAEKEIDIIALSQGGIIARYYIKHFADIKIRICITLCTPHQGSLLANIGILPGIKDLQPSSALLSDLDVEKADYYTVYNPLDLMVFPGHFARLECAKENKCIWALTHPLTFAKNSTLVYILSVLSRQF